MPALLSDRRARVVVPVLAGLLLLDVGLWTAWRLQHEPPAERCMDAPAECVGASHVLPLQTVLSVDGPERFTVGRAWHRIPVAGPSADLVVGEEVTVGGMFEADGVLRATLVQAHPLRPYKRWYGIVGMAVLLVLVAEGFRLQGGRITPRGAPWQT